MYLLPRPQNMELQQNHFVITYNSCIIIDGQCDKRAEDYAFLLKEEMNQSLGFGLLITKGRCLKNSIFIGLEESLKEQEYTLAIKEDGIVILGGDYPAILYGVQTLRQMLTQKGAVLPCLKIRDYPIIKNRGFFHDVTRGRIPTLKYLKELADKLSYYKLNQLQLYIEHSFLFREFSEVWRDDTPLTSEEIIELNDYCNKRNIELVPSISCFGHLYKVLCTKTYAHLCEMPDSDTEPFSFLSRMQHHTIDVSNPESLIFVKKMIEEFIPLFSSNQFNICADETFDLGRGKSRKLAEEVGINRMYINFVKELCTFIVEKGKRPMFWGDIICGFPEAIKELPKETICLNWGYAPNQREDESRKLYEAGAAQYTCPGAGGWNQFINLLESSYKNNRLMCNYAVKYHALGVLNTDWGDFGHINHPAFSMIPMIYGAAFSWGQKEIPDFDKINQMISKMEFKDQTEKFVSIIARTAENRAFEWEPAERFMELSLRGGTEERKVYFRESDVSRVEEANRNLENIKKELYQIICNVENEKKYLIKAYLIAVDAAIIFNEIGAAIDKFQYHSGIHEINDTWGLAVKLENWFYHYKELWRTVSKESELYRIQEVIIWYGDYLRTLKVKDETR